MASVSYGLVYALVASSLIVAHMAKEPLAVPLWAYALMLVGGINRQLQLVDTWMAAAVLMALATAGYLHYVIDVVAALCRTLKIKVFTIKVESQ